MDVTEILQNNFFFILEGNVLRHAIKILKFGHEFEVRHYLEDNKEVKRLANICHERIEINFRIKQMLYELYCFSFCNVNILKLCNVICIP